MLQNLHITTILPAFLLKLLELPPYVSRLHPQRPARAPRRLPRHGAVRCGADGGGSDARWKLRELRHTGLGGREGHEDHVEKHGKTIEK